MLDAYLVNLLNIYKIKIVLILALLKVHGLMNKIEFVNHVIILV